MSELKEQFKKAFPKNEIQEYDLGLKMIEFEYSIDDYWKWIEENILNNNKEIL